MVKPITTRVFQVNIQDLAAIAEIAGSVAVIASLIYLALQIRQTNVATHRSMYAQAATSISEFWLSLAKDPQLYASFTSMLRAPESLSEHERDRGYLVMDSYLSLMESYFLHNRQYGEQLSQERWSRLLHRMFHTTGGQEYWRKRKSSFHKDFVEYLDGIIARDASSGG